MLGTDTHTSGLCYKKLDHSLSRVSKRHWPHLGKDSGIQEHDTPYRLLAFQQLHLSLGEGRGLIWELYWPTHRIKGFLFLLF